jgi:hypothetical protein
VCDAPPAGAGHRSINCNTRPCSNRRRTCDITLLGQSHEHGVQSAEEREETAPVRVRVRVRIRVRVKVRVRVRARVTYLFLKSMCLYVSFSIVCMQEIAKNENKRRIMIVDTPYLLG